MRFIDLVESNVLREMNIPRDHLKSRLIAQAEHINTHLVKVLCVTDRTDEKHWKDEIAAPCVKIGRYRLKSNGKGKGKPASKRFYFDILFEAELGEDLGRNVGFLIQDVIDEGYPVDPAIDVKAVAQRLREFHEKFALGCSLGQMSKENVWALLEPMRKV